LKTKKLEIDKINSNQYGYYWIQ